MRPLTIPNFDDRIVQEGIRLILNSIYEPTFEKNSCNFGFREHLGTHDAVDFILNNGRGMTYAIEGDIEKPYDTINFNKLLQILNRKIKDKKFLNFIAAQNKN
jgi:retron-type reverse transcriptase